MKKDAVKPASLFLKNLRRVPCYGLTFPVRVWCQVDIVQVTGGLLQGTNDLLLALDRCVLGLESVFYGDAELLHRQILDMAYSSGYIKIRAKVFLQSPDLCG